MRLIITFLLVFVASLSKASTTTALISGDWTNALIWDNGIPGCFDSIVIPAHVQVDITSTINLEACPNDSIVVVVMGRIEFQNGKKLKLPCNSDVLVQVGGSVGVGSGGGASTYIEICSTQYWDASSGDITGPSNLCDGGCPPIIPLPVSLVLFDVVYNSSSDEVLLNWTTLSERENDFFTIERSVDGQNWEFSDQVNGGENSTITLHYSSIDEQPIRGVVYYRLSQTDLDGERTNLEVKAVTIPYRADILVFPNPSTAQEGVNIALSAKLSGEKDLKIFNSLGQLVCSIPLMKKQDYTLELNHYIELSKGVYHVQVGASLARFIVD